jgi:hypothetical protein
VNPAIFVNMPHPFTRKCDFHLRTCQWFLEIKDAHTKRAILSAIPPGEASAVKVETRGKKGAFDLDGAGEPYN